MSPQDFVYWIQGLFELTETKTLSEKQVKMIKEHLGYVFEHLGKAPQAVKVTEPETVPPFDKKEFEKLIRDAQRQRPRFDKLIC